MNNSNTLETQNTKQSKKKLFTFNEIKNIEESNYKMKLVQPPKFNKLYLQESAENDVKDNLKTLRYVNKFELDEPVEDIDGEFNSKKLEKISATVPKVLNQESVFGIRYLKKKREEYLDQENDADIQRKLSDQKLEDIFDQVTKSNIGSETELPNPNDKNEDTVATSKQKIQTDLKKEKIDENCKSFRKKRIRNEKSTNDEKTNKKLKEQKASKKRIGIDQSEKIEVKNQNLNDSVKNINGSVKFMNIMPTIKPEKEVIGFGSLLSDKPGILKNSIILNEKMGVKSQTKVDQGANLKNSQANCHKTKSQKNLFSGLTQAARFVDPNDPHISMDTKITNLINTVSKNYERKSFIVTKANIFGAMMFKESLGKFMDDKKTKVELIQKWKQTFTELKLILKIFLRNRKHKSVSENYEEFCFAVTNNNCCSWLRHYFYNPNLVDELDYRKFHNKPELLNGLTNLVEDLG